MLPPDHLIENTYVHICFSKIWIWINKRIIMYPINQDLVWMVTPYKSHDLSWFQTPARNLALDRLRLLQVLLLGSTFNWAECIAKWCPTPTWQLFSQAAHGSGNILSHTPPWSSKCQVEGWLRSSKLSHVENLSFVHNFPWEMLGCHGFPYSNCVNSWGVYIIRVVTF